MSSFRESSDMFKQSPYDSTENIETSDTTLSPTDSELISNCYSSLESVFSRPLSMDNLSNNFKLTATNKDLENLNLDLYDLPDITELLGTSSKLKSTNLLCSQTKLLNPDKMDNDEPHANDIPIYSTSSNELDLQEDLMLTLHDISFLSSTDIKTNSDECINPHADDIPAALSLENGEAFQLNDKIGLFHAAKETKNDPNNMTFCTGGVEFVPKENCKPVRKKHKSNMKAIFQQEDFLVGENFTSKQHNHQYVESRHGDEAEGLHITDVNDIPEQFLTS